MATIILLPKDLTSLDISESRYALISAILNKLDRTNKLTAINLSTIQRSSLQLQREGAEPMSSLGESYNPLRCNNVSMLINKCTKLTDIILCGARLSDNSILQICTLISPTVRAINFARQRVKNEHVVALARRCPHMKYINLSETMVSNAVFPAIATRWQYFKVNISLPERYSCELKLFTNFGPYDKQEEFEKHVLSMLRLEYLHVGHYRFHITDVMYRRITVRMLGQMFPKLGINFNPFGTQGPPPSDPNSRFKNDVTPENWQMRD